MTGKTLNLFGIILVACVICLCGVVSAATSVSVLPSVETVAPGEEFTLDVYIKPDTLVAGVQFDLNYDCSLVSIGSIEEGDFLSSTDSPVMFNPGNIDNDEGVTTEIYGTLIMGDGTSDEGTFCTIKLKASEETGTCQIRIENIILGDNQGDEIDAVTYDALISISEEEISDRDNDNEEGTELNIIDREDDNVDSPVGEGTVQTAEEKTTLQSIQDTAESTETQQTSAPEAESSTSNISILTVAAITFLALAYVLDRKRK
ncbi:cohesin domain-containing protein [Methanolobus tindarius DSM 2278]|uniref:Cohesin domain-containing protein n=1 Tax=Methanolobus tindarius DSM 2278 TaxID=1090322 RepID=W9DMV5_METTI|nr:cohesin domain-containing protein [Methanolobus tindarius]ETA67024.1 cohesin domain-containing protein [Methanolobus tindarius DSM 2278]